MNKHRLSEKILQGSKNIHFKDFCTLVEAFGFNLDRINGSHHIYEHPKVKELLNIQNVHGQVKPYQIKPFLSLLEKYNLQIGE